MENVAKHLNEHTGLLRKNAAECVLFLKKDGEFPLKTPCKVALYGNGARKTVKGGTGSGDVSCKYNTIEQALECSGFTVTTKAWLDAYDQYVQNASDDFIRKVKESAGDNFLALFVAAFGAIRPEGDYSIPLNGEGDVCLYVLARNSGEGNDRVVEKGSVLLTDTEVNDILLLNSKYKKFMLVLNVGGVVDLSPVKEVKNILLLSQLGVVTGDVFADVLLGKTNPSGKLAATWAKNEDYQTIGEFGDRDDTRYKEGVYVGYRYFDSKGAEPLYPFGYGLSYTEFTTNVTSIENNGSKLSVKLNVLNVGQFAGREVLQAYVTCPKGALNKPYQALVGFAKTQELKVGCSQELSIDFDLKDCASYFENTAEFKLEKGNYVIRIGNSSRNTTVSAVVNLSEDVVVEKVKNSLGKPDFEDTVIEYETNSVVPGVKVIYMSAKDFEVVTHDYVIDKHIDERIAKLTDEQLCHLCVGAHLPKEKLSVLGASACHVCGASGETSNYVYELTEGKYLVLADGPAGLRIATRYVDTPTGQKIVYENLDGIMLFLPEETQKQILTIKSVEDVSKIQYRYTTAIPIGTAIAQSWNPEFAALCGDIVGSECEMYGCHFWLAPAMNIQRSILCGRNFEYYSEDPLITGETAAGVVNGLQKHKNIGATIKHFCANNQERNRYNSNSIVSERAMREIYLKGFEICIKKSSPKAVMTSYNLLNGEHTSQRIDLMDGILRGEWGYKGFVMTDWIATESKFDLASKYPGIYAHKVINAGNDLVTPGGDVDFEDLMKALANGSITCEQLRICGTRVYEAIMENNN